MKLFEKQNEMLLKIRIFEVLIDTPEKAITFT